ncbi:hypothetical protein BRD22_10075 [Halobacteriales archaeon SW_8_68_21]|nr:MAG: hypothetical protein BRD22_10075 [Halobacteriales archaeon SW_8_68_21]
MPGPSKDHLEHLSEEELDEAIDQAQSDEEPYLVRRLCLIKNIYLGDTLTEAATRVGVTTPTASRWVDRWNNDAVDGLRPDSGSGRPPKLDEHQRDRLQEVLKQHQPLTTHQVQQLIEDGFDVSYSQRHTSRLLKNLGLNYAIPRPESPDRPDDAEEQLEERLEAALDDLDDDAVTDGGVVVGFLDEAWPRPTDNSRRLWSFGRPTIKKETPTANFDDVVFGFYALSGTSVVSCKDDLSKESVGDFFPQDT